MFRSFSSCQRFPLENYSLFFLLGMLYWLYLEKGRFLYCTTPLHKSYFSLAWAIVRVSQQISLLLGHPTHSLRFIFLNLSPLLKTFHTFLFFTSNTIKIFSLAAKFNHLPLISPKSTKVLASSPNMSPLPPSPLYTVFLPLCF